MTRRSSFSRLGLLVLMAACASPTGLVSDGTLEVRPRDADVQLRNLSERPVFYFMAERETLTLIDWRPCVTAECPSVAAHALLTVPHEQIVGFTPGAREAVVFWWRAVPAGPGTFAADSIRSLIVPL
jgi:hypothetical protein